LIITVYPHCMSEYNNFYKYMKKYYDFTDELSTSKSYQRIVVANIRRKGDFTFPDIKINLENYADLKVVTDE
jgi:hypothetical protein